MPTVDWSTLRHAYGPASDIPALLAQARTAPAPSDYRSEPWFSLWSSLYHQDDIYPASYAAVSELVAVAGDRGGAIAAECLLLAASIELRRHDPNAPAMPAGLEANYLAALSAARLTAGQLASLGRDIDKQTAVAVAVFSGDLARARSLLDEDS